MKMLAAFAVICTLHAVASPIRSMDSDQAKLLTGDAAIRALDAGTTLHILKEPNVHEKFLPAAIVNPPAAMWSFSMGEVAAQFFIGRILIRHGHARMAHFLVSADLGATGTTVISNFTLWHGRPNFTLKNWKKGKP